MLRKDLFKKYYRALQEYNVQREKTPKTWCLKRKRERFVCTLYGISGDTKNLVFREKEIYREKGLFVHYMDLVVTPKTWCLERKRYIYIQREKEKERKRDRDIYIERKRDREDLGHHIINHIIRH